MTTKAHLVLADGTSFEGVALGAPGQTVGEAVFTTGMTGYQEVITDPSYCGQIVTMTAPQIGNTGTNAEDNETSKPSIAGFVVHEMSDIASNWRNTETLDAYLKRNGIVAIGGVDTRSLTRHIRNRGAQMAAIGSADVAALHKIAAAAPPMSGQDLAKLVTAAEAYTWQQGNGSWKTDAQPSTKSRGPRVVAVDFGIKQNILRCLVDEGCQVQVVPASTSAADILRYEPDGIFLSNGPGDPAAVTYGIATIRELLGKKPIFGICLGHQLLGLALGCKTYKLKFGHRGLNQPVKNLQSGRIEITTQNHGFAVDVESTKGACQVTHIHLNDNTCQGIEHKETRAFGVQFHPEAAAGPHDSRYLFRRFIDNMQVAANN